MIFTLDYPSLEAAPNPVEHPTARTAAHEMGHGLGLGHQNCGEACEDLLMTSGRLGYQLVTGAPASVDEQATARDHAASVALSDAAPLHCGTVHSTISSFVSWIA